MERFKCGRFYVQRCSNVDEYFLFDLENADIVDGKSWSKDSRGYVRCSCDGIQKRLHRLVIERKLGTEIPSNLQVDHINQDKLDNRFCNLRLVALEGNARNKPLRKDNTTGSTGVTELPNGKFRVRICNNGKRISVGCFDTYREAVKARQEAENEYGYTHKQDMNCILEIAKEL